MELKLKTTRLQKTEAEKKGHALNIRLNPQEYKTLDAVVAKSGLKSKSDTVRAIINLFAEDYLKS